MIMKNLKGINWHLYKLYCYRNGLSEGQYINLKNYIETRLNYEDKGVYN